MKKTPLDLQEKRFGRRRTGLRRLLGLVLLVTAAAVAFGLWASFRRRNQLVNVPAALPKNVTRQLSGYTFTRTVKGREVFTIHAARTLAYEGARTELDGVRVLIYGPGGGRQDEVTTDKCQYDNQTGALACSGRAELNIEPFTAQREGGAQGPAAEQAVRLATSNVSYNPGDSTLETPDPVTFTAGTTSGSASGLAYNTRNGNLDLRKDVSFELAGGPGGSAPTQIAAGGLLYDKRLARITLSSPVTIEQGEEKVGAAAGVVQLDSQNRVSRVSLDGVQARDPRGAGVTTAIAGHLDLQFDPATSRIRMLSASGGARIEDSKAGALRRLTADSVTFAMRGTRTESGPRSATASGNVKLVLDPDQGSARAQGRRILTAPEMLLSFLPGGSLKEAVTDGTSILQLLPANPRLSRQTVSAGKLQMSFDDRGRLETIRGSSSTRIVNHPSPLAPRTPQNGLPAVSSADNFLGKIDPATGTLRDAEQTGHFAFEQGATRATADKADYEAASQQLALSGNPEVWGPQGRVRAMHLLIGMGPGIAKAWGQVQCVYFAPSAPPNSGPPNSPVIVLADRLIVNKFRRTALFEGNVRAWRGADRIASPVLKLDFDQHRLTSGQGVTTTLLAPPRQTAPGAAAEGLAQTVAIRAEKLEYSGLAHKAEYAGNVQMVSGATTFRSDRLEIYLASASSNPELERAVADGDVRLTQQPGRRATGQHADYAAATGKIVLTGAPSAIYDPARGYLTGKRLTFFIRDASLFADGGKKTQTLSKRRIMKQ